MALINPDDLAPFATIEATRLEAMIADSVAVAVQAAPCLADETGLSQQQRAAAKAMLRAAILRWHEAGSGAIQQHTQVAGPFTDSATFVQTPRKSMFLREEIEALRDICASGNDSGGGDAFTVDTAAAGPAVVHADICARYFGADYCSCGAELTGTGPIYETGGI